jgi:curved DNA-binding protein CbpA
MRTSEYIKKYDLKNGFPIASHEPFLMDFYFDFQSNVEIKSEVVSEFTESKFWETVHTFREKFESIFNKCPISYPEHIWDKFQDEYIPVVLFDFFPQIKEDMEKIKDMDYVHLYRYMFETLSMGDIIKDEVGSYKKFWRIPKPIENDEVNYPWEISWGRKDERLTNSPTEGFLEDIIKICKELLNFELYYVERVACERFMDWSENKLRSVRKINSEKESKRDTFFNNSFFNFFWYEEFKKKVFENMQKTISMLVYFERLGIKPTKDEDIIKKAYKQLAMKYHPDIVGNTKENHEKMVEINEAKTKCLLFSKGSLPVTL